MSRQLEKIATFTHGALFGIHAIGVVFHITRKKKTKWVHVGVHGAVMVYDLVSSFKHHKRSLPQRFRDAGG